VCIEEIASMSRIARKRASGVFLDWASLRPPVTEALLEEISQRIVDRFQPQRVVLFGSYACGEPTLDSDVDLLVVMESDEPMARRISRVAEAAQVRFLPMDLLVYTPGEIEERLAKGDCFITEILAKGKVLYQRDCGR
jgi:predicted nucleotidyltransferase